MGGGRKFGEVAKDFEAGGNARQASGMAMSPLTYSLILYILFDRKVKWDEGGWRVE